MSRVILGIPEVRRTTPSPAGRPDVGELVDQFGRVARDLRISITERCSLRCTYCMPAEGLPVIPRSELLSAEEIARLVGIGARQLGIREVRFTGGEPLTRADLVEIVARSHEVAPDLPLAMTTNGIHLDRLAATLKSAGLGRVNISLDTVDPERYQALTRRDRLSAAIAGIDGALAAGLGPVKLNAVLSPETLEGAIELLEFAVARGLRLRFIEQMPLDADRRWDRDAVVTAEHLLARLGHRFELTAMGREDPASPAEEWLVDGGPSTVGVIASVTREFCGECDRTRVTAEGSVRSCLFGDDETDLRALLRSGAPDLEIATAWRSAMWTKQAGHGMSEQDFRPPVRTMGAIGG